MKKFFLGLTLLSGLLVGCRGEEPDSTQVPPQKAKSSHWTPDGEWQLYSPPHGKYAVMMPGIPKIEESNEIVEGKDYPVRNATVMVTGEAGNMGLVTSDILWPAEKLNEIGRDRFLEKIFNTVTKPTFGAKIKERRTITHGGIQMDEIEHYPNKRGSITISREFLHGDYYISLTALYNPKRAERGDVARYFDSLVIR